MGFRFFKLNPIRKSYLSRIWSPEPHKTWINSSHSSRFLFQGTAIQSASRISSVGDDFSNFRIFKRWHMGHSHDHLGHHFHGPPRDSSKESENVFWLGLGADIGLSAGKALTGYLSGSTAIIADAAHSLSDVVLSGIALASFKAARVPKDKDHPYGHGKFETLGAMGISCMLLLTGGGIAWHAIDLLLGLYAVVPDAISQPLAHDLGHHQSGHSHKIDMDHPILALNMTILSIAIKEGLFWITRRAGEREGSGLMKANAWHHRADAISSVIALIGVDILLVNMSRRTSGDDNTSSAGMVRDAAWNFGESVDGSRQKIKCVFCGKVINGGITRLKEHLGHVKGNVAKCDQVSSEVRRNMEQMLQQMKKNKMEKKRRDIIIEEEITRATLGGDEEYEEEEDFQATLRRSRFEADLEYEQNMYRATHHEYYHEGGSSRQQPSRAMGRSYSLNVRGSQGSYGHVPSSTPSERLAAMNVSLEREQQMKKQTKINTGTKAYKSLKGKLRKAWGNWITHNKVQFSAIESPFTKPLMTAIREVGDRVPPPTAYELSEVYLKEQYQSLKEWIGSLSPQWKQWGVTIMCDGWTGPTKMHLINFLIYSKCGTVFHKSVDATHVPSKDADYYFMLMKKVVEEVGPEIVVQVVTDNEAAIKAGGKKLMQEFPHLYWTGCAAHCLDLILADISKKSSIHKILEMAQSITQFIYRYDKVVAIMLQFTNDRQLLRPGITRFATNFIALDSIVKHKNNLRNMWESEQWKRTKYGQMNDDHATKVRDIILQLTEEGRKFWTKANEVLKVQEPLVKVLRLVDGDDKPTMGFLYEAMERAKLAIKDNCRYWGSYWKIIDNRWNFQLHHDLHAAGYFLNPQFAYGNHGNDIREDREVMRGLKKVIQRLEPNIDNQIQAFNELDIYSLKQQDFSDTTAQRAIKFTNPAEWWNIYGDSAPHLKKIAMKVLSATTSSSNCERNWSTFSLMHTKSRNRLKYRKLNLLVYVHYNLRLQIRGFTRKSQAEMEKSYNPINLDYIFREDDVLNPWLEELEDPLLDTRDGNNQTSSWNGLDDDDIDDVDNEVQGGSSSFQAPELGEDPPIQYGVVHHSQATNEPSGASHGSHLSMSDDDNDDDGSGGGGGVGVGGDTYGYDSIGSYGQSNSAFHGHGDDPLTYSRGRRGDRSSSGRHSAYSDQRFHQFDYGAYQPFESVPPHLMSGHYGRSTSSWSETERYQGQNPYFDYQSSSSSYNNYGNTRIPLVRPQNPHPNDYYYHSNQNQNPEHPSQPDIQDDSSSSSTQYPQFHFSFSNFGTLNIGDVHNDYSVHYRPDQQDDYEDPPRHSVWW